jgi:hypothetical protein
MERRLAMMILLLVAGSLSATAVDWEEIDWAATVVSDYRTGLPAIIFTIGLAYDEVPSMMRLRIKWEVFSIDLGLYKGLTIRLVAGSFLE